MQGDTLSNVFNAVALILADAKRRRDEEQYYGCLSLAETLQGQLQHYEKTLAKLGMPLPYSPLIERRLVSSNYEDP